MFWCHSIVVESIKCMLIIGVGITARVDIPVVVSIDVRLAVSVIVSVVVRWPVVLLLGRFSFLLLNVT